MPSRRFAVCRSGTLAIEVRAAGETDRGREAPDDRDDLTLEAERPEGVVDRPLREPLARHGDVPALEVASARHLGPGERMAGAHDADEAVAKERLGAQLGPGRRLDDPGLEVDGPLAQRRGLLVGLGHETQAHMGRLGADARDQLRAEVLDEALARAQGEGPAERGEVGRPAGRRTASASCTSWGTRSRSSSARGVGTRPRPARTSSGSPVVSRRRASARLMAEGLRPSRRAAPATLPSSRRTSRVASRLKSGRAMARTFP